MSKTKQALLARFALINAAALGVVSSAHAALPTEATAAFTAVSDNATAVLAAVWPIVGLVTGGFILIRLFKKGANKAV